MLSAIIPAFNEINNAAFWANVALLADTQGVELIVVDGGSRDGTLEKLAEHHVVPLHAPDSNRARRFNSGIEVARGHMILLIHPRSRISMSGLEELAALEAKMKWGAFRHSFDWSHPILRFTSWYSNVVRGRRGIFYLDHCLFFSVELRPHARFPDVSIFEDTLFCLKLRQIAKPVLLRSRISTSAVRFRRNGVLRQSAMNQILKILFYLGVSEERMNRFYERGLWLNSKL